MRPPQRHDSSSIKSLPRDALVEILARLGSFSLADLFNARNTCKDFLKASGDNLVFQHLSMNQIEFVPWRDRDREFHDRCRDSGNAEALYRQGVVDFFGGRSAEKGHAVAMYVYGMILFLWSPPEKKSRGKEILSVLVGGGGVSRIKEFRRKVRKNLREMWVHVNRAFVAETEDDDCRSGVMAVSGWDGDEDGEGVRIGYCGPCSVECEARLFMCMIRRNFLRSS